MSISIYDQFGNLTRTVTQGILNEEKHTYNFNLLTEKGNKATKGFYRIKVTTDTGGIKTAYSCTINKNL